MQTHHVWLPTFALAVLAACSGGGSQNPPDATPIARDAGSADAGSADSGSADSGVQMTGDAAATDADRLDARVSDSGAADASVVDGSSPDGGSRDAGGDDAGGSGCSANYRFAMVPTGGVSGTRIYSGCYSAAQMPAGTGRLLRHFSKGRDFRPAWSPAGDRIALTDLDGLYILDLTMSSTIGPIAGPYGEVDWGQDGTIIIFDSLNRCMFIRPPNGPSHCDPSLPTDFVRWDPAGNGRYALLANVPNSSPPITGLYLGTSLGSQTLAVPDQVGPGFAWSPDGSKIAYVGSTGPAADSFGCELRYVEMTPTGPGAVHSIASGLSCPGTGAIVFDPTSTKIAFYSNVGSGSTMMNSAYFQVEASMHYTVATLPVLHAAPTGGDIQYTPDGAYLGFGSFELIPSGGGATRIVFLNPSYQPFNFAPN